MKKSLYGIQGITYVNDAVKAASGAPTTSTRGNLADIILDSDTGIQYYLSSVAGGVYTWVKYGEFTSDVTITGDVTIVGDVDVTGDVAISDGNALSIGSGAVTDYAGSGTLTAGVLAIANTNIAATDLVLIQRIDANSSTAIGFLSYTIAAGTSLTITSLDATASTETNDVSNIVFLIVKTA